MCCFFSSSHLPAASETVALWTVETTHESVQFPVLVFIICTLSALLYMFAKAS